MSEASDAFPARLRAARERRDLNQGELAKRASLQVSAISHFETGTRKPSFDNLRRLADALDVTTDYLLGRSEDFDGFGGAFKLHRHGSNLSTKDLELTKGFIKLLEERTRKERKT